MILNNTQGALKDHQTNINRRYKYKKEYETNISRHFDLLKPQTLFKKLNYQNKNQSESLQTSVDGTS